jgi:diguanylate cyclase (GGDEF)-like protein/PAS domain S-box-containing protein
MQPGDLEGSSVGVDADVGADGGANATPLDDGTLLRSLLGSLSPLVLVGADGHVLDVSAGFEQLIGFDRTAAGHVRLSALVVPADRARVDASLCPPPIPLLDPVETALVRTDGSTIPCRISVAASSAPEEPSAWWALAVIETTHLTEARASLRLREQLLDGVTAAIMAVDAEGRITYRNAAAATLYGAAGEVGAAAAEVLARLGVGPLPVGGLAAHQPLQVLDATYESGAGAGSLAVTITPLSDPVGLVDGWMIAAEEPAVDARLRELEERHERRLRSFLENLSDIVLVHGADGELMYVPGYSDAVFGDDPADLPPVASFVHPDDLPQLHCTFESWIAGEAVTASFRARGVDGEWRCIESVGVNLLDDPAVRGVVVTSRDVTERVRMQERMEHQALHDPVTALPNRALFMDRLGLALTRAERAQDGVAVIVLDIDGFKVCNDTYGHAVGDEVLAAVGSRVQAAVRPEDTVARTGGDELAVCCENVRNREVAEDIAARINAALGSPVQTSGGPVPVSVSIGVAVIGPGAGVDAGAALRNADAALSLAKDRGRHRVEVFSEELHAQVQRRTRLRNDLAVALHEEQLTVFYQPQVQLSTGRLIGFEALVRWIHPELGFIGPDEFIPIAEETGLILPLGRFVLDAACRRLASWQASCPDVALSMAVNLSARQLEDPGLSAYLLGVVTATGIDAGALCLEITESVVMERAEESEQQLHRLKACGVQLAVDDFGTGYSSLSYLKRFPLDWLKIDREFVQGLRDSAEDRVIVASVLRLAASLGLDVLAEGVETSFQRDELAALGCDYGQGYLWSRPLPADELDELVAAAGAPVWEPAEVEHRATVLDEEESANIDEVLAVLRHELANPVTVIQGYTELLLTSGEGAGGGEHLRGALDAISRSTAGLQSLIVALTDLRAIGAGSITLERLPVDLGALVGEILAELADTLSAHPATVDLAGLVCTAGDARRLRQILVHLLTNVGRHTPPGTPVEVAVTAHADRCEVVVADRGTGIPPDQAGQLFRKFSRLGGSEGAGLGLFLSRGLARAHGGDLQHRARAGGGSEFVLSLPRCDDDAAPAADGDDDTDAAARAAAGAADADRLGGM